MGLILTSQNLGMTLEAALEYIKELPTTENVTESVSTGYENHFVGEQSLAVQATQEQVIYIF